MLSHKKRKISKAENKKLRDSFERDGFLCIEEGMSEINEEDLMEEILESMNRNRVDTWETKLRMQTLMQETPEALKAMNRIKEYAELIVGLDYKVPENQKLREFASLTSFPGCKAQCWHRDSTEKDAVLITGFMNLYKTKKENGALQVIKGSHKNIKWLEEIKIDNISTIELPAKSLTFIDSRVIHRGGSNTSTCEIRPVIYASFGQGDLKEPGYFLDEKLSGKHRIEPSNINLTKSKELY